MKNLVIILVVIILLGVGVYFIFPNLFSTIISIDNKSENNDDQTSTTTNNQIDTMTNQNETESILGKSFGGRDIPIYQFGNGEKKILFVGGIHGGYAWNTSLLAQEMISYLKESPEIIPKNVTVTIVPILNPDGLDKTIKGNSLSSLSNNPPQLADTIEGRFNGNNVDLNRNFDCDWKTNATWQSRTVSGGNEVFSEPEAQAIKNYIERESPTAVVVWYSSAGGVFSSSCHNGILEETKALTNAYGKASGYPTYDEFASYDVNGDMVNWLAKKGIPAISVLLTNHNDIEWTKNKAGIEAVLNYYAE
ncbi:MAG: M14 family metallopeptidase [Candidatus Pacebacteria bacterium]|nr:M14 family metallopeptidase [Candidatus Paceibacterota bacterium]